MGTAGGSAEHHPVGRHALLHEFLHGNCVAKRTGRARSTVGQQIWLPAIAANLVEGFLQNPITLAALFNEDHTGAEKAIEQQIRGWPMRSLTSKHQNTVHSEACRGRRGLAAVVGLDGASGDQRGRPLLARFSDEEFQFARLVTAKSESGLIIALDQDLRTAEFFT